MITEQNIIVELKQLEKELQHRIKNIQTAIRVMECASEIVEACKEQEKATSPPTRIKATRTFQPRDCEGCGLVFTPTHNKQRFCKKDCNPNVVKKKKA